MFWDSVDAVNVTIDKLVDRLNVIREKETLKLQSINEQIMDLEEDKVYVKLEREKALALASKLEKIILWK